MLDRIPERFQACNFELHPGEPRIVYCSDINATKRIPTSRSPFYVNFAPAVSRDAPKAMQQRQSGAGGSNCSARGRLDLY